MLNLTTNLNTKAVNLLVDRQVLNSNQPTYFLFEQILTSNHLINRKLGKLVKHQQNNQLINKKKIRLNDQDELEIIPTFSYEIGDLIVIYEKKTRKFYTSHYRRFYENNLFIFTFSKERSTILKLGEYIRNGKRTSNYQTIFHYIYIYSLPHLFIIHGKTGDIIDTILINSK